MLHFTGDLCITLMSSHACKFRQMSSELAHITMVAHDVPLSLTQAVRQVQRLDQSLLRVMNRWQ